jgi:aminoglycoside phosphotransferase (APT) family kinase protein
MGRATRLLGQDASLVTSIFVWPDRQTHVVEAAGERYMVKLDDDHVKLAHEAEGQRIAGALGVPVAEIVAEEPGTIVMRFVAGTAVVDHGTAAAAHATGRLLRVLHDRGPVGADYDGHARWSEAVVAWLEPELRWCLDAGLVDASTERAVARALDAARPELDAHPPVWCHGDFQAAHVLVDPATDEVTAFLDFADHHTAEPGWDMSVFTIYDEGLLAPLLDGYGASTALRAALDRTLPLYRALRLLGSVRWLSERDHPAIADHLRRVHAWEEEQRP